MIPLIVSDRYALDLDPYEANLLVDILRSSECVLYLYPGEQYLADKMCADITGWLSLLNRAR